MASVQQGSAVALLLMVNILLLVLRTRSWATLHWCAANLAEPEVAERIRKLTENKLKLVFDTISLEFSAQFCNKAISTEAGEYSSLLDVKVNRDNVSSKFTLAYSAIGEAFNFGPYPFAAKPEDKDFARGFWDYSAGLLADGKIQVHPLVVGRDGLKGALEGLDLMRKDLLSGQKLVYNIAETP
ncbi:hypothetical protein BJX68DRAFT_266270 [Aspergillus pseudodeflectus]|uniref:Alcohol dehydrogenase-like C-terminal domain-containing protein n=1 Tax=Aspergillus pseudodeflectus TaxID=176178 RepID=A0ABR4KGF2_9EURO